MTQTWIDRFNAMADALEKDERIEVTERRLDKGLTRDEITRIAEPVGGLPAGAFDLYRAVHGFTLRWQVRPGRGLPEDARGSINLLPLARVLGDWEGAVWFSDEADSPYRPLHPFDLFEEEACAAFRLPTNGSGDNVWFHYFGEGMVDTGQDLSGYLERLLVSRGYFYWITALSPETAGNDEAGAFLRNAPLLFEDFDAGLFATPRDR